MLPKLNEYDHPQLSNNENYANRVVCLKSRAFYPQQIYCHGNFYHVQSHDQNLFLLTRKSVNSTQLDQVKLSGILIQLLSRWYNNVENVSRLARVWWKVKKGKIFVNLQVLASNLIFRIGEIGVFPRFHVFRFQFFMIRKPYLPTWLPEFRLYFRRKFRKQRMLTIYQPTESSLLT